MPSPFHYFPHTIKGNNSLSAPCHAQYHFFCSPFTSSEIYVIIEHWKIQSHKMLNHFSHRHRSAVLACHSTVQFMLGEH